tara:strand:+ start:904 stop:1113 length:210 start_codon:yes stop_codon:yes gene_type:complete
MDYYTMLVYDYGATMWTPEFGSYDKDEVKEEIQSWIDYEDYKSHQFLIICTGESQDEVQLAVDELNYHI